jgi:hypothetical protein
MGGVEEGEGVVYDCGTEGHEGAWGIGVEYLCIG